MEKIVKSKGPIFCGHNEKWKEELDKRLQTEETITLAALGKVKYDLLKYLNKRKDVKIIKLETRHMKKREKGLGLKVQIKKYERSGMLQDTKSDGTHLYRNRK